MTTYFWDDLVQPNGRTEHLFLYRTDMGEFPEKFGFHEALFEGDVVEDDTGIEWLWLTLPYGLLLKMKKVSIS